MNTTATAPGDVPDPHGDPQAGGSPAFGPAAHVSAGRLVYWSARRELWENRWLYIAPLIVAAVALVGFALGAIRTPLSAAAGPALMVGADGRHSSVREKAGFTIDNMGAPMDVLWMRLSGGPRPRANAGAGRRRADLGDAEPRGLLAVCVRHRQGRVEEIRQRGLPAFREEIARLVPSCATAPSNCATGTT